MALARFAAIIVLPIALFFAEQAVADSKVYSNWGKAIKGYDPVAYFTKGKPIEGKSKFSHSWNGANWRFANAENRDRFKSAPEKYAPQYGGYCAWAVSQGYTAPTDPEAWKIVGGKLYLNYSKSVQAQWNKSIPQHIAAGDANWPKIEKGLGN
ncbi:MAG: YHS domain-containing (seleno)protein [Rhodospirillales bacterium]